MIPGHEPSYGDSCIASEYKLIIDQDPDHVRFYECTENHELGVERDPTAIQINSRSRRADQQRFSWQVIEAYSRPASVGSDNLGAASPGGELSEGNEGGK